LQNIVIKIISRVVCLSKPASFR